MTFYWSFHINLDLLDVYEKLSQEVMSLRGLFLSDLVCILERARALKYRVIRDCVLLERITFIYS